MKVLKGLALSLLGFLLFLSLTIFGLVFTLSGTVLNPNFLPSQLDKVPVSALVEELLIEEMAEEDPMTAIIDAIDIDKLEASLKEQIGAAIGDIYDYVLGKREQPELAATLGNTFLNSTFVGSVLDAVDLPLLVEEVMSEQMGEGDFPEELMDALLNTITENETEIKQQVSAAADPVFEYLLGETQSIDLAYTLRSTLLTPDLVASLITSLTDALDLASLAGDFVGEQLDQLAEQIPQEMQFLAGQLDSIIADAITELEPTLKVELVTAADDILGYLLGESSSISMEISLESVEASLEEPLRELFMQQLPSEYAGLPQSQLDQLFDATFADLAEMIPPTIEVTEDVIPDDIVTGVADALAEVEDGLEDAREAIAERIAEVESQLEDELPGIGISLEQIIGYYQLVYWGLLGFMALLILGIVLIHREVKGATRGIGITALTYGAIQFGGILIGKNLIEPMITDRLLAEQMKDIPAVLQDLPRQLLDGSTSPMQTLSLGLLIGGVVLIVVSFVYPRLHPSAAEAEDEP